MITSIIFGREAKKERVEAVIILAIFKFKKINFENFQFRP